MNFLLPFALTTLLPCLAHTLASAIVFNNCTDTTVYLWSVGSRIGDVQTIDTGKTYSEEFRHDSQTGGISLKITTVPDGIYTSSPETDYAYSLVDDNTTVWYDISDVNGDPFANYTVALVPSSGACRGFVWENGVSPSGTHTASCSADVD
ncbi:putative BYS1 domain protein, partial [Talaromyces proteolyticus]